MKANVGTTDKFVRYLIAAAALIAAFTVATGVAFYVLVGVAVIMVLTAIVNFCPIYALFGVSTCPIKKASLQG